MRRILLCLLMLPVGMVQANPYGFGETVPIPFVVPDTIDGEPITPDSIQIAIYFESGTTAVVAPTDMTGWNGKTGEYYYNFTTPDSEGVFVPRINWGAQGKEYVLWLGNICVAEIFDPASDTVFADVGKISGDVNAANNMEYFYDGTGAAQGVALSARRLTLENNTSSPALYVYNSGGTAAKFYTDHAATGENWSYGLALLSGSGQSAPLRILGAGSYSGAYGNLQGSVSSVTNKVTVVDSTAADISYLANAGLSTFNPAGDSVNARANVTQISNDAAAADNLEYFLDGTGHTQGVRLSAAQLKLSGNYLYEGALHAENAAGNAAYFKTTANIDGVAGLYLFGDNTGNHAYGLNVYGDNPAGDAIGHWNGTITANAHNADGEALAVRPESWTANDSIAYQGDAAGLGADDIWNYDGRTIEGGWVDSNKTETGSPMGDGMYAHTFVVIDTAALCPVPGVRVAVRSPDQTALVAAGITDASGKAAFNLDAGSFLIVVQAPGYIFMAYDTVAVDGPGCDSLYCHRFDPGRPAEPDLCRVFGYLYDIAANPQEGAEIRARLNVGARRYDGSVVSPLVKLTQSDSLGYFYLDLIPSSLLVPDSPHYEISITLADGTILRENVLVPNQDAWQLTW